MHRRPDPIHHLGPLLAQPLPLLHRQRLPPRTDGLVRRYQPLRYLTPRREVDAVERVLSRIERADLGHRGPPDVSDLPHGGEVERGGPFVVRSELRAASFRSVTNCPSGSDLRREGVRTVLFHLPGVEDAEEGVHLEGGDAAQLDGVVRGEALAWGAKVLVGEQAGEELGLAGEEVAGYGELSAFDLCTQRGTWSGEALAESKCQRGAVAPGSGRQTWLDDRRSVRGRSQWLDKGQTASAKSSVIRV